MSKLDDLKRWRDELAECTYEVVQNERQMLDWAIQQIDRPADAEIDKAIEEQEKLRDNIVHQGLSKKVTPIMERLYKACQLAIQALRQMRTEPCEWCDTVLTLYTHSGKFIPENQPPRNYCPSCGRKLKGE